MGFLAQRETLLHAIPYRLSDRQIAGGQQRKHAFTGLFNDMHLGKAGDMIQPRIGARIGKQNKPILQKQADAIGHGKRSAPYQLFR